jgi:hypothetical protein
MVWARNDLRLATTFRGAKGDASGALGKRSC